MIRPQWNQLRRWQWALVGLAVGALVGSVRVLIGPAYLDSTARTLSKPQFERAITATPAASFAVSDMVIHPPDATGAYWITGRYRQRGSREIVADFKFRAPTPYPAEVAINSADLSKLTIAKYLDELARHIPGANCRYRYAWYENPGSAMLLWTCAATVLIGGVWPTILRRLAGAVDPAEPLTQVVLEVQTCPLPSSVEADPPQPLPQPPFASEKDYGGDFYPTEVHARR